MAVLRISAAEVQRDIDYYQNLAQQQPVAVTRNGQDSVVLISAEEYRRLKRRDRQVLGIEDFTDADIETIRQAEPSPDSEAFNHELDPGA